AGRVACPLRFSQSVGALFLFVFSSALIWRRRVEVEFLGMTVTSETNQPFRASRTQSGGILTREEVRNRLHDKSLLSAGQLRENGE
ncbi:MAG: hypothetical protein ACLP9L_16360, partial [Thermoguttaceae bacterium]